MPTPLTAAAFLSLRPAYRTEPAAGELPAVVEHLFADGVMVDHYRVAPAPALLAQPEVAALGEVSGVLFIQQPDGAPWRVCLNEPSMKSEAVFELPDAEFRAFLAQNSITLPGE